MTGWRKCLGGVGVSVAVGVLGPAVPSAEADCLDAVVYVTREGAPPVYVHGEHDPCVTQTPWSESVTYHEELTDTGMPDGAPNGYWIDLRIPAP